MKTYWTPRFFDGETMHNQVLFRLNGHQVSTLETDVSLDQAKEAYQDLKQLNGVVCPAFIDLQVNGGGGVLFNDEPTVHSLNMISDAHNKFGTGYLLPTVITDNVEVMAQAADAVAEQIKNNHTNIIGIHFEGPHISQPKKGVHPSQHVRGVSAKERALYQRTDLGIKKITLAPESVSLDDLAFLKQHNWHVAVGHTNSTAKQIKPFLEHGATGFTHLFNAMSQMTGREPGAVGLALGNNDVFAGIILDGHHVDYDNAKLAWEIKNKNKSTQGKRLFLVSDAMATVGSSQTRFNLFGQQVKVAKGKLTTEDGTLAGAHLTMLDSVKNAVTELALDLEEALLMATTIPAHFLNCDLAKPVVTGDLRQLIAIDDENWQVQPL